MRLLHLCLILFCSLYHCAHITSLSPSSPASSSSKNWRKSVDSVGDDAAYLSDQPAGNEPLVPYIKTIATEIVSHERYPVDRLKANDPAYLEYINTKKSSASRSAFSQQLTRKLSSPNFTTSNATSLSNWLILKGASIWDAVRIIESPNFDGTQLNYLNKLPIIYLKQRMLVPFTAFLKRFEYETENDSLFSEEDNTSKNNSETLTTPFTNLVFGFLDPSYLNDPSVDPFLKTLIETQPKAFEACEGMFFDAWIRSGTIAWRYLKLYFDHSHSVTKSYSLVRLLTSSTYSGPVTSELIEFILSFKSFDPNVRVPFADDGSDGESVEKTAFLHILVLDSKFSTTFLPHVLRCKSLDTSAATGTIIFSYNSCQIVYTNEPIVFLAGALGNSWAILHLILDDRIADTFKIHQFLLFLILHFLKIIWLSLENISRAYYHKFHNLRNQKS